MRREYCLNRKEEDNRRGNWKKNTLWRQHMENWRWRGRKKSVRWEREILREKEIKRNIEKKREILYEQAQRILYWATSVLDVSNQDFLILPKILPLPMSFLLSFLPHLHFYSPSMSSHFLSLNRSFTASLYSPSFAIIF